MKEKRRKCANFLHRSANYPRFLTILVRASYALVVHMPRAMVGSTMGIVFLPVGKSAHFFVGDLFLRGPRANRGQKKSYGRFPGKKTYCNNQPHIIYSHRPQPSSTPPSPSTNKLYSFAVVHHRPPLSTAARCHPLPSTAIPCRLFPRPPLSAAHLVVICPQRICPHLPLLVPPPTK